MISSSKQVFLYSLDKAAAYSKGKKKIFWPSYCTKSKLDNLLDGPSRTNKLACCHNFFCKLPWWLLLSMHISITSMLQSNFLKEYYFLGVDYMAWKWICITLIFQMVVLWFLVQKRNHTSQCFKLFGTKRTHSCIPGLKEEAHFLAQVFFVLSADLRLVQIYIHKFVLY